MPLVHNRGPLSRIRGTQRLLFSAALMMSVLLLSSSFVTTLLIPESAYQEGGAASGRALAYLAHEFFGPGWGSLYDAATIFILWFAGASAMAGMLHLIPRYLPRFGLAPGWAAYSRPLILVLFLLCALITLFFSADVEAQAGAYATGVLVLILSASFAVSLALFREARTERKPYLLSIYFWFVTIVFAYTLTENIIDRPDGAIIGGIFVALIIFVSILSRTFRSTELRVSEITFADDASAALWQNLKPKIVNLVPIKHWSADARQRKSAQLRTQYQIQGPLAFVHIRLLDNRTDFVAPLRVSVVQENQDFLIEVDRANAIANSLAYVSELLDPKAIFLELTRKNLLAQASRYIFWGEGETALMVYAILLKFWAETPEEDIRPMIFLMSD